MLVGAADTFRAAAEEQLEIWAERAGADFVGAPRGADPAAVAFDAVEAARARGRDVAIIDTAGRLHTQSNLMAELEKVRRVIEGRVEGAPHETLLVVDATTGQNGLQQAKLFGETAGVTGVALTKLDGSARGGVAIAIAVELGLPVKLVGVGEGVDDLRPFDAGDYARALIAADLHESLERGLQRRCTRRHARVPCDHRTLERRREGGLGMAVAMTMHWPGLTSDQYDAVMARLGLDANPPAGAVLHMATVTDEGVEVYDIWQTEQAFNGFLEQRLLPVVSELGITGEPEIRIVPLHNLYAADPHMIDRIGAVSLPAAVASWSG